MGLCGTIIIYQISVKTQDIFLKQMLSIQKKLWISHKDLPFLPERKKIRKSRKLACIIEDKDKYVIHIRALKQALNNGLKF